MKRDVTKDEALRRAAAYCSRSEHCTGEVRAKLMQWGLAAGDADSVVADLAAQGFVDDRRYARAFVHDKSRLTGWGRTKIAFHLRAKMIDGRIVDEALREIEAEAYASRMDKVMSAKARTINEHDPAKRRAKLLRFGASRGYEYDMLTQWMDAHGID